jgi:hypothetical protein
MEKPKNSSRKHEIGKKRKKKYILSFSRFLLFELSWLSPHLSFIFGALYLTPSVPFFHHSIIPLPLLSPVYCILYSLFTHHSIIPAEG